MKPLNQLEIEMIAEQLSDDLRGAQLQDIWAYAEGLVLHFYLRQDFFLLIDVKKSAPYMGLFQEHSPVPRQSKKKPVGLFLSSHGKNLFVKSVEVKKEFGRVIELHLASKQHDSAHLHGRVVVLQLHLIPHRANVAVQLYLDMASPAKKIQTQSYFVADYELDLKLASEIFWNKPYPMEEREPLGIEGIETRSFAEMNRQWESEKKIKASKPAKLTEAAYSQQRQKNLIKKNEAMDSIRHDLTQLDIPYVEWGKFLSQWQYELAPQERSISTHSSLWSTLQGFLEKNPDMVSRSRELPEWLRKQSDGQSIQSAVELLFEESKNQARKIAGLKDRLQGLDQEVQILQSQTYQDFLQSNSSRAKPQRQIEGVKARKMNLISGAIVYLGKSAQDNLKILRAAKSWDYWLHLRDLPGAHAIIHRDRTQNLSDDEVRKVAQWVIRESMKSKQKLDGQKFEVIMTECRFVKPIKGDRLGRVNFSNEKHLIYYFRDET